MNFKKNFYVLIFLVFFIHSPNIVKADYECYYKVTHTEWGISTEESNSFKVSTTQNTFTFDTFWNTPTTGIVIDSKINNKYTEEYLITNYLKGCCPNEFYVCRSEFGPPGGSKKIIYLVLLNGALFEDIEWKSVPFSSNSTATISGYPVLKKDCVRAKIDKDKTNVCTDNILFPCEKFQDLEQVLRNTYCKTGEANCTSEKRKEYAEKKEEINSYCRRVLNYGDYNVNPCVNRCIALADVISDIEGINVSDVRFCGFSEQLIAWIRNIIKYAKYFLPVIVIVLGILDFISAIASNKDEDIKKAQDKFVKRLISAALVFLVPLIIGFILDQFGFTPEYCGVFK